MNRTIVTAVLLLLCICATSTNAVKMDARLSDILNSKMQAIHALGAEPCVPLKDPCTYGKEIGEQLSRMAQQIVTQNGLQAQQGRQIITEWINHTDGKCADKKCAIEVFELKYGKFGMKHHKTAYQRSQNKNSKARTVALAEVPAKDKKKAPEPKATSAVQAKPGKKGLQPKPEKKAVQPKPQKKAVQAKPKAARQYPGCEIGSDEYISTSEIRERIQELKKDLHSKGSTCDKKDAKLRLILSAYEELLKEESGRLNKLNEDLKKDHSCSRRLQLTKLLLLAKESKTEAQQGWYDFKTQVYLSEENRLRASKDVALEQIEQIHIRLPKAGDSEALELRKSLFNEVKNLKKYNKRLHKLSKKRAKLSFSIEKHERALQESISLTNNMIAHAEDKCEKKILNFRIKSLRRRYEIQQVQIKKAHVKEKIAKLRKKEAKLLMLLEHAKTHEEREKIRHKLAMIQKKFTMIKKKYGKLVHIREYHHSKIVMKELHSSKKSLQKKMAASKDVKQKKILQKKLKKVNVKIRKTTKRIIRIKKQIKISSTKHVISKETSTHKSSEHHLSKEEQSHHSSVKKYSKITRSIKVTTTKHKSTHTKKHKKKIVQGLVEETDAIEMEKIVISNIHTQIDLQNFIKNLTVKTTSEMVEREYNNIILNAMHKVEPLVNKVKIIEVELNDHLMELAINKKRIGESWDPVRTELLKRRIIELKKLIAEQKQEVSDLIFQMNKQQRRIKESQLRMANLTHQVLKLVPSVKRRVYRIPDIKPIGSGSHHYSAIPMKEVYFEELVPKLKIIIAEAKNIVGTAAEQEVKQFVEDRIKIFESTMSEVEGFAQQIVQTRTDNDNIEKQIDAEITTYVHELDDAKRAKLEQQVDQLKHTLKEKLSNIHTLISTINQKVSKLIVVGEEIAYKSGGKIHLPPMVKEEKTSYRKLRRLQRVLVSKLKQEEKIVNEIFSHKMPMTTKNCRCCVDYMRRTQHHMKLMHRELEILRKHNGKRGRIHDPNELVRQLRQKIDWLKEKNAQLQIDYKNYVAREPQRVKIIREKVSNPSVTSKKEILPELGGADGRVIEVHIKEAEQNKNGTATINIPKRPIPKKVVPHRLPGDKNYPLILDGDKKYIKKKFAMTNQRAVSESNSPAIIFQRKEQETGTYGWKETKKTITVRKQRKLVTQRISKTMNHDSQGNKWHSSMDSTHEIGHHGEAKKVDGDFTKTNDKITIKFFKETHKNASGKKQKKQHKKAKRFASKRDSIDGEANPSKLASSRAKPAGPGSSPAASQPATKARVRTFKQGHKALALAQSDSDDLEDSLDSAILMV